MAYKPGESGNPKGRPKGARRRALDILEEILAEEGSLELLHAALKVEFLTNQVAFFDKYVLPFESKNVNIDVGIDVGQLQATLSEMDSLTAPGEVPPPEKEEPAFTGSPPLDLSDLGRQPESVQLSAQQ